MKYQKVLEKYLTNKITSGNYQQCRIGRIYYNGIYSLTQYCKTICYEKCCPKARQYLQLDREGEILEVRLGQQKVMD